MLNDDVLKALIEGIIYVTPEPVTLDSMVKVLEGEEHERIRAKLDELVAEYEQNTHGIQIRQVANGYKFSTKAEHHETLRKYVKSLKPPVRLSKPALETLAVIAYRQPVTVPEIEEIRGVDAGGVIHTLLEKKLVVTAGRKSVVGRPILYRTSKDFLVHFGLKDVGELPSLKEFEELAKRALGAEWTGEAPAAESGLPVAVSADSAPTGESVPTTSDAGPAPPPSNETTAAVDASAPEATEPAANNEPVGAAGEESQGAAAAAAIAAQTESPGDEPALELLEESATAPLDGESASSPGEEPPAQAEDDS